MQRRPSFGTQFQDTSIVGEFVRKGEFDSDGICKRPLWVVAGGRRPSKLTGFGVRKIEAPRRWSLR